jgi:hypothetical protein
MKCLVAATLLFAALAPAVGRAEQPAFEDSLAPQMIPIARGGHVALRKGVVSTRVDSLPEDARTVVLANLLQLEWPCRTQLFGKDLEPGSPWLTWRSFGRVDTGDATWFAAALSCTDTLCLAYHERESEAMPLVLHDRLALLAIGRDTSRVWLLPKEPATIGDAGTAVIDSVASIHGPGYALVQVRRRLESAHPCYDGGDYVSTDEHYFLVLRGDSLTQCFRMIPREEWISHDDVDGDQQTNRTATVSMSATSVRMSYRVVVRQYSPDADVAKPRTRSTRGGTVEVIYDPRTGRFRRVR